MIVKWFVLLACMCLIFGSCIQSTTPVETGAISGRVVYPNSNGIANVSLIIYGTNFSAITDTGGHFCFYNVPAGTYKIFKESISDTTPVSATVVAGKTTVLPDMIRPWNPGLSLQQTTYIVMFNVFDASSKQLLFQATSLSGMTDILYHADSVFFEFSLNSGWGYPTQQNLSLNNISILQNGVLRYDSLPEKWRVHTKNFGLNGIDTFFIQQDSTLLQTIRLLDSTYVAKKVFNKLHITVAPALISKDAYFNRYYIVNSDTFGISYNTSAKIDWDIFLVNDSISDTCYWKKPHPDWGQPFSSEDDPKFTGDWYGQESYDSRTINTAIIYQPDEIQSNNFANGTYSIYVRYFDGPTDSITATPVLSIELGTPLWSGQDLYSYGIKTQVLHFWQSSPGAPLKKGQVWYAGKIKIPEMKYEPCGITPQS